MEWSIVQTSVPAALELGGLRCGALLALVVAGMPAYVLVRHALRRPQPRLDADLHEESLRRAA